MKVLTRALLKKRVKRGAALLDRKMPNWYCQLGSAMFNGTFSMNNWNACVAGTLEIVKLNNGWTPTITLNGESLVGVKKAATHGFYVEDGSTMFEGPAAGYDILGELWREEVESRLTVSEAKALGM